MDEKRYRFLPAWDPVLRFLHWWNAAAMTAMVAMGVVFMAAGRTLPEAARSSLTFTHSAVGFLFGAGILARIIWLFIGPETARWTDMLPVSAHHRGVFADTIRFYLRGLKGEPPLYLAHNSFAGGIYLGFFALSIIQVISGSTLLGLPEKLRHRTLAHEAHETVFYLILLYIAAHLVAVFVHEIKERHGIVSSMIHGKKTFTESERERMIEAHPNIQKGEIDERED